MKNFFTENGRLLLVALAALLAGIAIGMLLGLAMEPGEAAATGTTGVRTVLPATRIKKQTHFTLCDHRLDETVDTTGFVGYTEAELKAFYGEGAVAEFAGSEVLVIQTVEGCCPAHYLLSENETGQLCIYRTDPQTLHRDLVRVLSAYTREELNDAAADTLEGGVLFSTLREIDTYLESMES